MAYTHRVIETLITVVEVPPFPARAAKVWNKEEYEEFINHIARHPEEGEEIEGTGGLRKIRWKAQGRGKRGGVRVIYYFYNSDAPLYLLTVYAKNQQEDLSSDEKAILRKFVEKLKSTLKTQRQQRPQI
jgi:hypothetical protein